MRAAWLMLVFGCGEADKATDTSLPTDTGGDADTDSDADSDTDSDSDSDTEDNTAEEPEPVCADVGDPVTPAAFLALYRAKICWWWDGACGMPGNCPRAQPAAPDCTFDAIAACDCLDGDWSCDGQDGSPLGDPVCDLVYDCPVDTGWWVDSGRPGDSADSGDSGGSGR